MLACHCRLVSVWGQRICTRRQAREEGEARGEAGPAGRHAVHPPGLQRAGRPGPVTPGSHGHAEGQAQARWALHAEICVVHLSGRSWTCHTTQSRPCRGVRWAVQACRDLCHMLVLLLQPCAAGLGLPSHVTDVSARLNPFLQQDHIAHMWLGCAGLHVLFVES